MSKKRIIKALKGLGLSQDDARVYVFLAKYGPHKEKEIIDILKLYERQTVHSLKNLQEIEIVIPIEGHPISYSAVPFEEVIDLSIEVKKEQAKTMQESKEELLSSWKTITNRE